jgi:hypothetical protein
VNVSINIIVAIAGICLIDLCYIFATNYIFPSPDWQAVSRSATQEFPNHLRKTIALCHVQKSPLLVPNLELNSSSPHHSTLFP